MSDDRKHIGEALRAMRRVDLAVCSYAETGDPLDLDAAHTATRRLRSAIIRQKRLAKKAIDHR